MAKKKEEQLAEENQAASPPQDEDASVLQNRLSGVRQQIAKRISEAAPTLDRPFPDNFQPIFFTKAAEDDVLKQLDDAITEYSRKGCCEIDGQMFGEAAKE